MKKLIAATFLAVLANVAMASDQPGDVDGEEAEVLTIDAVPKELMDKVREVTNGVFFSKAELRWHKDFQVYDIIGAKFSEYYVVSIRDDGKVLKVYSDDRGK